MASTARRALLLAALSALPAACGTSGRPSGALLPVPVEGSPQRGPDDAWVTMVEFADFQCPYCRAEEPVLVDLLSTYGADLRLVFKYFPLAAAIHPYAQAAAVAAECAGEQGKFWEMHDLLFVTALDDATLLADAGQVGGLDLGTWQACTASSEAARVVAADRELGEGLGVPGTPTFVLNGVEVVGAVPEADLEAAIDRARAAAIASGVPRGEYYDQVVLGK
ncbi:MAG TPA: thioredoxin domain-containing protein [Anaeromyxobacter sp.]|nr:thioredoxin domain-containing protein [Anaeromyxobacter sp.]